MKLKYDPSRRDFVKNLSGLFASAACAVGGWLLAKKRGQKNVSCLRPPGALPEKDFLAACIRCGRCADACPNRAIAAFTERAGKENSMSPGGGQLGTPVIFPRRQACMLCNGAPGDSLLCTQACPTGALTPVKKKADTIQAQVAMGQAEVDKNLCYSYNGASCGACVRACPFEGRALKAGLWEKPIIDPALCVGCGLCERACIRYPQAIRVIPSNHMSALTGVVSDGVV